MTSKKNKTLFPLFTLTAISLVLAGCAISPQKFGISKTEWKGYDKAKRKEILKDYKQLSQEVKQQDQDSQIMVGGGLISLDVKIFGGKAMLPPFTDWDSYMPTTFTIAEDSCFYALLNQADADSDGLVKTTLRVCYKDKKLRLDPSRYDPEKKDGTVTIPYSPLWEQGFTYHGINTDGYVKLKNATVVVKLN